jgi:hypothetical protein|tara:strand:- start:325 stop:471 length:147 start_codon:yes stop_codon:yes gene_type:complete
MMAPRYCSSFKQYAQIRTPDSPTCQGVELTDGGFNQINPAHGCSFYDL